MLGVSPTSRRPGRVEGAVRRAESVASGDLAGRQDSVEKFGRHRYHEDVESGDLAGRQDSNRHTCVTRKQTETPIATGSSDATVVQRALRVSL